MAMMDAYNGYNNITTGPASAFARSARAQNHPIALLFSSLLFPKLFLSSKPYTPADTLQNKREKLNSISRALGARGAKEETMQTLETLGGSWRCEANATGHRLRRGKEGRRRRRSKLAMRCVAGEMEAGGAREEKRVRRGCDAGEGRGGEGQARGREFREVGGRGRARGGGGRAGCWWQGCPKGQWATRSCHAAGWGPVTWMPSQLPRR